MIAAPGVKTHLNIINRVSLLRSRHFLLPLEICDCFSIWPISLGILWNRNMEFPQGVRLGRTR